MQRQDVADTGPSSVQINCLKAIVASAFSVREWELGAPSRCRAQAAFARQVAMYLAHVTFAISLSDVASSFGRDRTTASHACHVVEDRREDVALDYALDHLANAARLWAAAAAFPGEPRHG
jgi:chromosomal replication initiation ATPase DnaA